MRSQGKELTVQRKVIAAQHRLLRLRTAKPNFDEGRLFYRYLDSAAEGFFVSGSAATLVILWAQHSSSQTTTCPART